MNRSFLAAVAMLFHGLGMARGAELTNRFEFVQPQMGLPFRMVIYAGAEKEAKIMSEAAFARIAELNSILSDYEEESELMRLSRTAGQGKPVTVSRDLWQVLQRAQSLSERTRGAFDITVGPAVQLWRRARRQHALPDPARIADALSRGGYRHVMLNEADRTVLLETPGMRLDAGGIAKGYAVDEGLKVLRTRGVTMALIAGGGDMAVMGSPPAQRGWRIEVAPLDIPGAPPARYALLKNNGLATSGDVFQRLVIEGRRYSHIVDPRTGFGLTNSSLVTVIARNCAAADSLATAVSVLGPVAGLKLIEKIRGAEVYIVYPEGDGVRSVQSSGWVSSPRSPEE